MITDKENVLVEKRRFSKKKSHSVGVVKGINSRNESTGETGQRDSCLLL